MNKLNTNRLNTNRLNTNRLNTNRLQFSITTRCKRGCPWCSLGIPKIKNKKDNDYEYLEKFAPYFQNMEVVITGGEPSLHADFGNYIKAFISLYNPRKLICQTDGSGFKKDEDAFNLFDVVEVSRFSKNTYPNCKSNVRIVNYIKNKKDEVYIGPVTHEKLPKVTGRLGKCGRTEVGPVLLEGHLYPCCCEPGLKKKNWIKVTENWREEIQEVKPSCERCPFAT